MSTGMKATGVVLAGGNAVRMGGNKARLEVGGEVCLRRLVRLLAGWCREVLVVVGKGRALEVPAPARRVEDIFPNRGPLGGIHAALVHASHPLCLVVACDMPFLRPELVELLFSCTEGEKAVVCQLGGYLEPFPGVYPRSLLPEVEQALRRGELGVQALLRRVPLAPIPEPEVQRVDPTLQSFVNLNTPADLALADILTWADPAS